nr:hypothetical protein [Tanacetum cinerariifolium]
IFRPFSDSEVMEIVILEVGGIKASTDNPIPSHDPIIYGTPPNLTPSGESEFFSETKSSSTSLNSLLEETRTFDNSLPEVTTFSNDPCDAECESDDQSYSDEDVLEKIVSLFDEFAGELTLLKSIPPGINETDCHPEEETHFTKRLLYDNSSPRPPEEFVSDNSNADIKSFSPSSIPIKDSDSHMEEIDLSLNPVEPNSRDFTMDVDSDSLMEEIDLSFTSDDSMSSRIEEDDYDSERDMLIFEKFLCNDSLSLPENESFHFDIPSFSRPPTKLPDDDSGILSVKMMGDISEHDVPMS